MKNILVATDFTPASTNALLYAVNLARPFATKVILYHAYLTENYIPDFAILPGQDNLYEQCNTLLKQQVEELDPLDKLIVETVCEPGIAAESIINAATRFNASLIITGMKRHGKAYRKIFGTTALNVCRHASMPVIVVPENAGYQRIKTIAMASDLVVHHNAALFDPLKEIAGKFHAEVFVVSVFKQGEQADSGQTETAISINWELKELSPGYQFIENDSIADALEKFVYANDVNLLAMVAHPHSLVEKLFVKSSIKELLFKSNVPLLVLADKIAVSQNKEEKPVDANNMQPLVA